LRTIKADVERTHPEGFEKIFGHYWCQESLKRLLYIWSMINNDISYFQGLNELCTPMFLVFLTYRFGDISNDGFINNTFFHSKGKTYLPSIEADTFWCLTNIITMLKNKYIFTEGGLFAEPMVTKFELLITKIDPKLQSHLSTMGIHFFHFSFRWMLCLMIREFSIKNLIYIWDRYITYEGFSDLHILFCAAFLIEFSEACLKCKDMSNILVNLQHLPTQNWTFKEIDKIFDRAESYRKYL